MIVIERAPVAEVLASKDLIAQYAAECSISAIGEISPQDSTYALMEANGVLQSFMVREDGDEIGFAIVLTPILPHYGKRVATLESLFVTQMRRSSGAGRELMASVEAYAREAGCVGVLYSAPAGGSLERLLDASKGYERTNAVFYRGFK